MPYRLIFFFSLWRLQPRDYRLASLMPEHPTRILKLAAKHLPNKTLKRCDRDGVL
jgi:hypothetical protein